MDTLQHGTTYGLAAYLAGCNTTEAVVAGCCAMMLDLGTLPVLIQKIKQIPEDWNIYNSFHTLTFCMFATACLLFVPVISGEWINNLTFFIFLSLSLFVHKIIDNVWHKPEGGWKNRMWLVSVIIWWSTFCLLEKQVVSIF